MPRGKFVNHKGRMRHFTNPEELEKEKKLDLSKNGKNKYIDLPHDGVETPGRKIFSELRHGPGITLFGGDPSSDVESYDDSDTDSDSDSGSEPEAKAKGVENLIEIENPNRTQNKYKKLSKLNEEQTQPTAEPPQLSRKQKEHLAKQKAIAHYKKLHAAGKTEEARADLARLAIVKQQREEAAKKRELEKVQKELAAQKQKEMTQKALGKRT